MKLVLDFAVVISEFAVSGSRLPQKSALHHNSKNVLVGHTNISWLLVWIRNGAILSIACLWEDLVLLKNWRIDAGQMQCLAKLICSIKFN